jgi:hypothetical protein
MLSQSCGGNLRGLESTTRPVVAATDSYGFQMSRVAHRDVKLRDANAAQDESRSSASPQVSWSSPT